jgi:hypothetical protein
MGLALILLAAALGFVLAPVILALPVMVEWICSPSLRRKFRAREQLYFEQARRWAAEGQATADVCSPYYTRNR